LEFNVHFQHKYGYIRDEIKVGNGTGMGIKYWTSWEWDWEWE